MRRSSKPASAASSPAPCESQPVHGDALEHAGIFLSGAEKTRQHEQSAKAMWSFAGPGNTKRHKES